MRALPLRAAMAGLGDLWDLILASLEATLFTVYLYTFRATRWFLQVRLASLPLPPPSVLRFVFLF